MPFIPYLIAGAVGVWAGVKVSGGFIKHETSEKSKYQHPSIPVTNGVLSCSTNGDGVAYSVFTAPQGGKAHNAL
ncbi:hypothetical protein J8B03_23905, partial [Vibrio parahaemolyticus]|nr:hypothetical protein [Vibrio parahaemolyticus]